MFGPRRTQTAGALVIADVPQGLTHLFAIGTAVREGHLCKVHGIIGLRHKLIGDAVETAPEAVRQYCNLRLDRIGVRQLVPDHELLA